MKYVKGEVYFPIIIGLHLLLWALDLSLYEGTPILVSGESLTQRVLGEVFSSWVVTVFGFNLLMATRARWVERIFGGLDKMYVIHRRSGIVAAVLLLLHFATVPRHPEFTVGKPMGFLAMVLLLLGTAFAAAPLMKRKLPYHRWVAGHRLMGAFYVVGVAHALFVPTLISELPLIRGYVFGMAFVGCSSWFYRAFIFRLVHRPLLYTVTEVRRFGRREVEIHMTPKDRALDYKAGQFAFLSFESHAPQESHPFTIASPPNTQGLRVVVKACGDFTSALVDGVAEGDVVRVEGPYGHLTERSAGSSEQVWLAGGIGITPFLARAHALSPEGQDVKLFWSVRSPHEAHFDKELAALARENPRFEYTLWPTDKAGYLSLDKAGGEATFAGKDVVICGPTAMRDSLTTQLRRAGAKASRIHSEEFAFR